MKIVILISLLLCGALRAGCQAVDTFQVYFPLNDPKLSKGAIDQIDRLIFKDTLVHGQKLVVLGYADYVGDSAYNESLSGARAQHVKDYLVTNGFDSNDIKLCMGKGKISRRLSGRDGFAEDRKVQIIIDRKADSIARAALPGPVPAAVLDISQAKVNETVVLKNILFQGGMDIILPESLPELDHLYKYLDANPNVTIQIEGHICCLDPKTGIDLPYGTSNLSTSRAMAVFMYLVLKGIDKNRLKYLGLGITRPLVMPELTETDRQKNRRVEVRILSR